MSYLTIAISALSYDSFFEIDTNTPERKAFAAHIKAVTNALREIHRVEEKGADNERECAAIRACIGDGKVLEAAIEAAHEAAKVLRRELEIAASGNPAQARKVTDVHQKKYRIAWRDDTGYCSHGEWFSEDKFDILLGHVADKNKIHSNYHHYIECE